jgi:hypothetical protein
VRYGYWQIAADWIPFLIFISLLIYFMTKLSGPKQRAHLEFMKQYYAEHLAETKKISANVERIAAMLEKRGSPNE